MIRKTEQPDPSACLSIEMLLRHVIQPEGLTKQQCEQVTDHIAWCERCANIYEALCDADGELWEDARRAAGVPKPVIRPTRSPQEALADLWRRIDADEAAQRQKRRRTLALRIGGAAAATCVLIAIGAGWVMTHKGQSGPGSSAPGVAANAGGTRAGFAELVTRAGREPLALNQPFATAGQPQEILLGGMHRVVMNRDTEATFSTSASAAAGDGAASSTPQRRQDGQDGRDRQGGQDGHAGKIPYEIQLAHGELYVEVVPGHAFTVRTANARLAITGTKFDVLADGDKTELTLLKGSVRFTRPADGGPAGAAKAFVDVPAGHASAIVGRRAPTPPRQADALAATAWARGLTLANAVAAADPDADLALLDSVRESWPQSRPVDLASIDYVKWRDDHRDWFAREFPWIFKAQKALKDGHGIDADYIELLMISGDIWQFHYDPKLPGQPLVKLEPQAITRLARHYGLDEKDILKALGLPKSAIATMPVQDGVPGQRYAEALRHWHDVVATAIPVPDKPNAHFNLKFFSLNASYYLAETRTAAYLWAKNNPENARQLLADKDYLAMMPTPPAMAADGKPDLNTWLKQLHDEANAARSLAPAALDWFNAETASTCPGQISEQQTRLAQFIDELTAKSEGQEQ